AGERVGGRYTLKRLLGQGGFGQVWRAKDDRGPDVALKMLHRELLEEERIVERFEREGAVLAKLDHPNVARLIGFEVSKTVAFLALELIEGTSLEDELHR